LGFDLSFGFCHLTFPSNRRLCRILHAMGTMHSKKDFLRGSIKVTILHAIRMDTIYSQHIYPRNQPGYRR
jgi:hypothetical protein